MNDVLSGQKKFSHTTAMYMRLQVKNGQRAYAYREVFVCVGLWNVFAAHGKLELIIHST